MHTAMPTISRRALATACLVCTLAAPAASPYTMEQVKGHPFPTQLTAAATGSRIAWAFNEKGLRNVWTAEGPQFTPRRLTSYVADDGQEITSLSISANGRYVVYVRGGDHGSNQDASVAVNPASSPTASKVQVWSIPWEGGEPKLLGDGDEPAPSPRGDQVAFVKERHIWIAPVDGSAPARLLASPRGENGGLQWSPDGSRLAFVSDRGDHSLIGIFSDETAPILWIAPATSRDGSPRWAPDGSRLAFVRRPGRGGPPEPALAPSHEPWSIWIADAASGEGRERWRAPATARGSLPTTHGGTNLHWAAGGRIVFLSYADGWPHLYSMAEAGGEPLLLTPGPYMAEHIRLAADRRTLVFAANAGSDADDVDRRHVVQVAVDRADPRVITPGTGLEWAPVLTGDGGHVAFVGATAQRPPLPMVIPAGGGEARALAADRIPADFPTAELVVPRKIVFRSADGTDVHGQLFERPGGPARKPAVIFVHGGPPRQMLLGWHYSDYYSNAYAVNQYLAHRGFVVLSVNFRLGIGYGYEFHHPPAAGRRGAAEYQDIKAAGEWLRSRPQVDPARVGIYGGSYGGYLTALALALDSNLFAAGVDIHGVHDWSARLGAALGGDPRYEKVPDAERAAEVAWRSSPASAIATWRSPVLVIHADDDRNVRFSQSVDLVRRLAAAGVPYEELVIPDDTHHFMRHANQVRVNVKTAEFLERKLMPGASAPAPQR
jgi:dipeptidyl aminopeptidase/acylaminoacyl peptidase